MAYLLPISHAWLLILRYTCAGKRGAERWREEEEEEDEGLDLHLGGKKPSGVLETRVIGGS